MKNERVLITDDVHPLMIEGLENAGYLCDYMPDITLDETRVIAGNYVGMVINSKIQVDRAMLEGAPDLRFVGRLGSGLDIIDLPAAAEKGVAVLSVPEGNANAVAEHALGMLLALANNLIRADREVRQKLWFREKNRGFELDGRTIGIIGFGNNGSAFARKLEGFDVKVLAYDKYKQDYAKHHPNVVETTIELLIRDSDIISFHVPLTKETYHWVDREWISGLRDGAIIINTSRGKVVDTGALVTALEDGKLGGACLDVFENEKPVTFSEEEEEVYQRLYALDQVVLSPHIAGWTVESKWKIAKFLLEKIIALGK